MGEDTSAKPSKRERRPKVEHDDNSPRKPLHKSKLVRLAAVVTLLGAGLWGYAAATRTEPAPAPPTAERSKFPGHAVSTLGETYVPPTPEERAARKAAEQAARPRLIDDSAPATFRLGASFLAGIFLGWAFRKFIKLTVLVAGALALGIFFLKKTGVIDIDWAGIEKQVEDGVEYAQAEAGRVRQFLTGYFPSGMAAAAGLFFGVRKG